jgi:hypothetical protein
MFSKRPSDDLLARIKLQRTTLAPIPKNTRRGAENSEIDPCWRSRALARRYFRITAAVGIRRQTFMLSDGQKTKNAGISCRTLAPPI